MGVLYTFNPPMQPDIGIQRNLKPVTLKASFGDGYSQRVADGQNNKPLTLNLTWSNLLTTERDSIINFFKARRGYQSFFYTYQDESSPSVFICQEYSSTHVHSGIYTVTAVLQQVYDVGAYVAPVGNGTGYGYNYGNSYGG